MANVNVAFEQGVEVSVKDVNKPNQHPTIGGVENVDHGDDVYTVEISLQDNSAVIDLSTVQTTNDVEQTEDIKLSPVSDDVKGVGSTLSFHDVTYVIPTKFSGKKAQKVILKNVSGVFKPGMNAILGPTGSGKTSLLDVLAARKNTHGLMGTVLIDGAKQPPNFRLVSGYVVQDDVVMGTLSIRENLAFSAALRLSSSLSEEIKRQRVEEVIKELGLERCADTMIGTDFIRGVSGGERKRTNVGMELITRPEVLFLDEPTTGLDASTANSVMTLLSRLSKNGKTIIFSIHQPRYSIFRLFDKLHLLSRGETVYHGLAHDAIEYFLSIGYQCEVHNNPPDFFLDVINGDINLTDQDDILNGNVQEGKLDVSLVLVQHFSTSSYCTDVRQQLDTIWENHKDTKDVEIRQIEYQTSFKTQMSIVSRRAIKNLIRNPVVSRTQIGMVIVLAFLVGTIYFDVDNSITSGIQNRYGAFFFMTLNMVFNNMSSLEIFIKERVIFMHESANGFYRVSSYFLSKVLCDLLPVRVVPTIVFSIITYWMIGLKPSAACFFIYTLNLIMTSLAACSIIFCVGARINTIGTAMIIVPLCFILMVVFGGLFVNIESLPPWLNWLQYISIFRYSVNTLSINEFRGLEFCDGTNSTCITGEAYLESQGILYSTWGLWQNQVALLSMLVILSVLAYIQMRTVPKWK